MIYSFAPKSQGIYSLKAPRRRSYVAQAEAYRQSQLMQLCQVKLRHTRCSVSILCSFSAMNVDSRPVGSAMREPAGRAALPCAAAPTTAASSTAAANVRRRAMPLMNVVITA